MGRTGFNRVVAGRVKGNGMGSKRHRTPNKRFKNRIKNRGGGR